MCWFVSRQREKVFILIDDPNAEYKAAMALQRQDPAWLAKRLHKVDYQGMGLGKLQRHMLDFIATCPGWHSIAKDAVRTAESLHKKGLIQYNAVTQQIRRIVYVSARDVVVGDVLHFPNVFQPDLVVASIECNRSDSGDWYYAYVDANEHVVHKSPRRFIYLKETS